MSPTAILGLFILLFAAKSASSSPIQNSEVQTILTARIDGLESKLDKLVIQLEEEKVLRGNLQSLNAELEEKINQISSENAREHGIFEAKIDLIMAQNIKQEEEIRQLKLKIKNGVSANINQPKSMNDKKNGMANKNDATNFLILDDSSSRLPPSSCRQLSTIGHYLDGIYLIANPETNKIETVYCDFGSSTISETLFGNVDVKSKSVHFYVQKDKSFTPTTAVITFDIERLNVGGAMNFATGVFTVPVNGIYHFEFSGLKDSDAAPYLYIQLQLNGIPIDSSYAPYIENNWVGLSTVSASLRLKTGDQVSLVKDIGVLRDDDNHYTHFTGWLVEEDLQISV